MTKIFKKTYKFAGFTSTFITFFLTALLGVFFYWHGGISYWFLLLFFFISYFLTFFVIQYRVEKLIYKQVKKIYNDVKHFR